MEMVLSTSYRGADSAEPLRDLWGWQARAGGIRIPRAGGALGRKRRGPGRLYGGGVLRNNHRTRNVKLK